MKYRIVKTEDGNFRIQTSFLGLFWNFYSEPIVYYSKYNNGFVREKVKRSLLYNNKENAEEAIKKIKEGNLFYKKFRIDSLFVYDFGKYECKYFVVRRFNDDVYHNYFDAIEQAKSYIDKYWGRKENEEKKNKVKEVLSYY